MIDKFLPPSVPLRFVSYLLLVFYCYCIHALFTLLTKTSGIQTSRDFTEQTRAIRGECRVSHHPPILHLTSIESQHDLDCAAFALQ